MNGVVKENGDYLTNIFEGDNGKWRLIGTRQNPSSWKAINSLDTFKNDATGEYLEDISRYKVFIMAENGLISPVLPF